jgi:hypothetical protein
MKLKQILLVTFVIIQLFAFTLIVGANSDVNRFDAGKNALTGTSSGTALNMTFSGASTGRIKIRVQNYSHAEKYIYVRDRNCSNKIIHGSTFKGWQSKPLWVCKNRVGKGSIETKDTDSGKWIGHDWIRPNDVVKH